MWILMTNVKNSSFSIWIDFWTLFWPFYSWKSKSRRSTVPREESKLQRWLHEKGPSFWEARKRVRDSRGTVVIGCIIIIIAISGSCLSSQSRLNVNWKSIYATAHKMHFHRTSTQHYFLWVGRWRRSSCTQSVISKRCWLKDNPRIWPLRPDDCGLFT